MKKTESQKDIHMNVQMNENKLLLQLARFLLSENLLTTHEYANLLSKVKEET